MSWMYLLWCRNVTEICLTLQFYKNIEEVSCVLIGFHGNILAITFCNVNFCFAFEMQIIPNNGKSWKVNKLLKSTPPGAGKEKGGEKLEKNRNYIFYNPSTQISLTPLLHFYRFYTIMYINRNTCSVLGWTDRRSFRKKIKPNQFSARESEVVKETKPTKLTWI